MDLVTTGLWLGALGAQDRPWPTGLPALQGPPRGEEGTSVTPSVSAPQSLFFSSPTTTRGVRQASCRSWLTRAVPTDLLPERSVGFVHI